MIRKYWRFNGCPHEWESIGYNTAFVFSTRLYNEILYCPHCDCKRKVSEDNARISLAMQKVRKRYGYMDGDY